LNGEIRSAYIMTEPATPPSDAKNISCRAELDGDEWVINGEKYWSSGAGDPRCKIMIVMVRSNDEGPPHQQQSQILVPGRIHHCMRAIGAAEKAVELMVKRGVTRDAFDKKLANLGKNTEMIAKSRVEIESMRMMAFKGAKTMDVLGNAQARVWVSAVNALALTRRPPTTPARAKVRAASLADPDRRAARALPSSRILTG
jgi:acyl-CoA dehydrogenase